MRNCTIRKVENHWATPIVYLWSAQIGVCELFFLKQELKRDGGVNVGSRRSQ